MKHKAKNIKDIDLVNEFYNEEFSFYNHNKEKNLTTYVFTAWATCDIFVTIKTECNSINFKDRLRLLISDKDICFLSITEYHLCEEDGDVEQGNVYYWEK